MRGLFAYVQAIDSVTGVSSKTQVTVPRWTYKQHRSAPCSIDETSYPWVG